MYKAQDQEEYKTTTIRIRKEHYDILKDKASEDYRSTNYLINKILIEYIISSKINFDVDIFKDIQI